MEKYKDAKVFSKYDVEKTYFKNITQPGVFIESVTFNKKISTKYGVQYKVEVEVVKEALSRIAFNFEEVYTIPFPSSNIFFPQFINHTKN